MWKIIKKSVDSVIIDKKKFSLWMKWEFKIEFANDSFWPYNYKFTKEDCYFNDGLQDRWSKIFPLKWKTSGNTEIFLETSDIVIAVWERWSLKWENKTFIDIINIKTEKKYRLFTTEVNLIYNQEDKIIVNAEKDWEYKTVYLDTQTLEKLEEKSEWLLAFFKCVYNDIEDKWYRLDFFPSDENEKDQEKKHKNGFFSLVFLWNYPEPVFFDRKNFMVNFKKWILNVWEKSFK